jgi:hypothetical protein
MEINLDLGLVNAQFDESNVALDAENNVSGVLSLTGTVDGDWIAAFDQSGPLDAPWRIEDGALRFGPIPVREFAAYLGTLRNQITVPERRRASARWPSTSQRKSELEPWAGDGGVG